MIVKIWPINADYANEPGKVGGVEGLKKSLEYICDEEKVIAKQDDLHDLISLSEDSDQEFPPLLDENAARALNYMANEDKVKGKYISGYLCRPEDAVRAFGVARQLTLAKAGQTREKEEGAIAFHIVQSFPEGLDISDEEVHRCGLELCERIGAHQAVVCSHVHPAVDEASGEVHGKCKHNHILINAYIHPDKWDPEHPGRLKYNDCKESYAQLRVWNDEIAIEHGLPIIRNPDEERTYSWKETDAHNKGLSWKERIRMDIDAAKRLCANWDEFRYVMQEAGYSLRETSYVTYIAPDGKHKARAQTLGNQYTKSELELYWSRRDYLQRAVDETIEDNTPTPLFKLIQNTQDSLLAGIPIGNQGNQRRSLYYLPLDKTSAGTDAIETWFNRKELYDIFDNDHVPVAAATGDEIIKTIELLQGREQIEAEQEIGEDSRNKRYYVCYMFINTETKQPYRTSLYDQNGRRRSTLELLFILAATILKKEDGLWNEDTLSGNHENEILYADTNWKIQNMVDAMYVSKAEGIETVAQLDRRLDEAGAHYSRARSALKKTTRAKEKMEPLDQAITDYLKTKDLAERLLELPDGPEKAELQEQHKNVILKYKNAKAVMYRYEVTEPAQIDDFVSRYKKIREDIKELKERFDSSKEQYRKLKKLHYNVSLAQNAQYCYGPAYTYERAYEQMEIAQRKAQLEAEKQSLGARIRQRQQDEEKETPERENEIKIGN